MSNRREGTHISLPVTHRLEHLMEVAEVQTLSMNLEKEATFIHETSTTLKPKTIKDMWKEIYTPMFLSKVLTKYLEVELYSTLKIPSAMIKLVSLQGSKDGLAYGNQ